MSQSSPPFWLGGVAASLAACCTHPLDLTKVRMQTLPPSISAKPSMLKSIRFTIHNFGFSNLYTGLSASLMRQMSYSLVRLGTYDSLKGYLSKMSAGSDRPSHAGFVLAGAVAGGLGGIVGNPADVLLVRMTTDSVRPPEQQRNYRNALHGLVRMVREEGAAVLGRGLGANTTRAILMNATQLSSYDFFKTLFTNPTFNMKDGVLLHATASCASGVVATTICSPADVLKSRIMSSQNSTSILSVLRKSLREEGPGFLFKGWTPSFIRLGPNTVLLFVFLEQFKKMWTSRAADR